MPNVSLDLKGRLSIVTGASRRQGIGAAVCRAFAAHRADVFFTHWQPYDREIGVGEDVDGPRELERELRSFGVEAHGLEIDLADPEAPARVFDEAQRVMGAPSILVNNATHSTNEGYDSLDAASLDAHYAVNLRATALLSVEFARRFEGASGGRIINLTSGQSVGPMPDELAYIATKGAVEAFTTSLAAGVAARGITVNAVDPGVTDTGWMSPELKECLHAGMAFGRLGRPADAANLILFLASDAGKWITGQVIHSRDA